MKIIEESRFERRFTCALILVATSGCIRWRGSLPADEGALRAGGEAPAQVAAEPEPEPTPVAEEPEADELVAEGAEAGEEPREEQQAPASVPEAPAGEPEAAEEERAPVKVAVPQEPVPEEAPPPEEVERDLGGESPPASDDDAPPRYVLQGDLLGKQVFDHADALVGRIEDLLFDGASGALVAVVVLQPELQTRLVVPYVEIARAATPDERRLHTPAAPREASLGDPARFRELYDGREASSISGEVTDVELAQGEDGWQHLILKLRDENNVYHRVLLGPAGMLAGSGLDLEVGKTLSVQGHLTRDEKGKLCVATVARVGDKEVRLRDAGGAFLWADLARGLVSGRALTGAEAEVPDGDPLRFEGFVLDTRKGALAFLLTEVGGAERLLPWSRVLRNEAGGWTVPLKPAELEALPKL